MTLTGRKIKQTAEALLGLSMATTARVIWLCACARYWPYRGVWYVCLRAEIGIA